MKKIPTDFAIATFEAALVEVTDGFHRAGLTREEIRAALERRLTSYGGPTPPVPFDPARVPDGRAAFVDFPAEGGGDAG